MGNARRAPYGSSKAAKTKNSPQKRRKSPPPPPPPQKFHPKNLGPLPNITPADDLTDIVALANVVAALAAYMDFARRIGVLSVASLPLIGAGGALLAGVSCIFFMNYDVDKPGHTVYDGHTDMDNNCVRWATRGLWSAIGLPAAVVRSISAKVLVIDIFSLKLATHDADGKRLNPEYEYVRVCEGYENAKQLALLYRDLIVAILIYVKVKKGRAVPVVSFGLSAASFVTAHLTGLDFVDVIGALMHPEAFLALPTSPATLAKKIANGKVFAVATKAATYVKADAAVAAVVALLAPGATFFASFHVGAFNGHAACLGMISKARSEKSRAQMLERWASMTTAAREAFCKKLSAAAKLAYDAGKLPHIGNSALTKARHEDGTYDGKLPHIGNSAKSKADYAAGKLTGIGNSAKSKADCAAGKRPHIGNSAISKARFAAGKCQGLVKKGGTHSEATKAKMRAAKRTDSTKVWVCPNPKCGFETTMPSRVLRKHFHNEPLKTGNVAEYSKECKAWLCEKADDTATLKEVFGQRFKFYL